MITLPEFIKQAAERAIYEALHPQGMHTNGPAMARIEASQLQRLLMCAEALESVYTEGYQDGI